MTRYSNFFMALGLLLLLAGVALMFEPFYTWAQEQDEDHPCRIALDPEDNLFVLENLNPGQSEERSITVLKTGSAPAELFFAWEYMEGDPPTGAVGSLFEQLEMTVRSGDTIIFDGVMGDWLYDSENPSRDNAVNLTSALGMDFIRQGDEIVLTFTVTLPGPTTGNVFQGATLLTRLVFFTLCEGPQPPGEDEDEDELIIDPDDPQVTPDPAPPAPDDGEVILDPEDPRVTPDPGTPGPGDGELVLDPEEPRVSPDPEQPRTVVVMPESPRTSPTLPQTGGASYILQLFGLLLLGAGLALRRASRLEAMSLRR